MKRIFCILALLLFFASCKKQIISEIVTNGEVMVLVNAKRVDAEQSKAVSSDGFNAGSVIGLYSQVEREGNVSLDEVKDENFGYKFSENSSYWEPLDANKIIYFTHNAKLSLYGYHPYSGVSDRVSVNSVGDRKVRFELNVNQNSESDLYYNDLMYAKCSGIFQEKSTADMEFSHKLCKITFNIYRGANWGSAPLLTDVYIKDAKMPSVCDLRLFDGSVTTAQNSTETKVSWSSGDGAIGVFLNSLTPAKVDLLVLPYSSSETVIGFKAGGVDFETVLPTTDFKSATNINYKIILNDNATGGIEIEPSIVDWEVVQSVNIKPF